MGLYLAESSPLLGYGGIALLVPIIGYEYLRTVTKLIIQREHLDLHYPFRRHQITRDNVAEVQLTDIYLEGSRVPQVEVALHGSQKRIRLQGLRVDSLELHRVLSEWKHQK